MKQVLLGLSGGVDSSVAAELLKKEYEVSALYLDTGSADGLASAQAAAERAGISLAVADVREELETLVCQPFAAAYMRGETPNPCVLCNPAVKLYALEQYADAHGIPYIATGHYARRGDDGIYIGKPANDQSYMLCRISRSQAEKLLLPLGELEKAEVRALARRLDLPAAKKADSMEICFVPGNDYGAWLSSRGLDSEPGEFWYHGKCIGQHKGISRCTVGQHRNLGVAAGKKVYVQRIDPEQNRVYLADDEELMQRHVYVRDFSWLVEPKSEFSAAVRIRHSRKMPTPCRVRLSEKGGELFCDEPVRAPAPGQSAVLYDENGRLLGGGFITASDNAAYSG